MSSCVSPVDKAIKRTIGLLRQARVETKPDGDRRDLATIIEAARAELRAATRLLKARVR